VLRGPENGVRDAECVERGGEGNGEGVSPPQPTRGSGGASYAPPAGSGADPRPKTDLEHFELGKKRIWL